MNLLLLEEDSVRLTQALAAEGTLHITDWKKDPDLQDMEPRVQETERLEECRRNTRRAGSLLSRLGIKASDASAKEKGEMLRRSTAELLESCKTELSAIGNQVDTSLERRSGIETEIKELDSLSEGMHLLKDCNLSPEEFFDFRFFYVTWGILEWGELARLYSAIEGIDAVVVTRHRSLGKLSLLLIGDQEKKPELETALSRAGFKAYQVPGRFRGSFEVSLDKVEMELWQLRDSLAEINRKIISMKEQFRERLSYWKNALEVHAAVLGATGKFAAAGEAVLVSGFIPHNSYHNLIGRLERETPNRYFAEVAEVQPARALEVPTKLSNLLPFRPFELLTRTYGVPGYGDIDPTPLVCLSFLVMFGMMFGDVGHGAVLSGIGAGMAYLPYRIFENVRNLGKIISMAGLSGVFFGFLFGTVFGIERDSVLPALWMRPGQEGNLQPFLVSALILGIAVISLGMILNIVQGVRRRDLKEVFLGQWSVSTLAFYWTVIALLGLWALGKNVEFSTSALMIVLAAPLVLIIGGQLVCELISKRKENPPGEIDIATLFMEPVEIVMSLFANTLSFLRVAAFGLAHAALTMVAFIIADMVPAAGLDFLTLPLEHLAIIVLEGMVVTIQAVRLEYYEFFSKFFTGEGTPYEPLSVES